MFGFQKSFEEFMAQEIRPERLGTRFIESELKAIGIIITNEQKSHIKKIFESNKSSITFNFTEKQLQNAGFKNEDELKPYLETIFSTKLPKSVESFIDNFQDFNNSLVNELVEDFSNSLEKELYKSKENAMKSNCYNDSSLKSNIISYWGESLSLLDELVFLQSDTIDLYSQYYNSLSNKSIAIYLLLNMFARANQVAKEIILLLKNGFADGAEARWRTLHELVVISAFISENGENVAEKYIDYQGIEEYKAAVQYNEHFKNLGGNKIPNKDFMEIQNEYNRLINEYGNDFKNSYGWAISTLNLNKKLNFTDIEKSVNLEHYRPYYKSASYNIHANPYGVFSRLGLLDDDNYLLNGGSYIGLDSPGESLAISMNQMTVNVLTHEPTIDALVICNLMDKKLKSIQMSFIKEREKLEGIN